MLNHPSSHLLSILAAIAPDTPLSILVESSFLSTGPDLTAEPAFVHTMIPFRDLFFELYFFAFQTQSRALEQQVKGLLCAFPWANEDLNNTCWIDEFARAYKMRCCALDLFHTIGSQLKLR